MLQAGGARGDLPLQIGMGPDLAAFVQEKRVVRFFA
jgi:hypothetical protein